MGVHGEILLEEAGVWDTRVACVQEKILEAFIAREGYVCTLSYREGSRRESGGDEVGGWQHVGARMVVAHGT